MSCNAYNHSPDCNCGFGGDTGTGFLNRTNELPSSASPATTLISARNGQLISSREGTTRKIECWWCGAEVYYHSNGYGDHVLFDSLGYPWEIHSCWLDYWNGKAKPPSENDINPLVVKTYIIERAIGVLLFSKVFPEDYNVAAHLGFSVEALQSSYYNTDCINGKLAQTIRDELVQFAWKQERGDITVTAHLTRRDVLRCWKEKTTITSFLEKCEKCSGVGCLRNSSRHYQNSSERYDCYLGRQRKSARLTIIPLRSFYKVTVKFSKPEGFNRNANSSKNFCIDMNVIDSTQQLSFVESDVLDDKLYTACINYCRTRQGGCCRPISVSYRVENESSE